MKITFDPPDVTTPGCEFAWETPSPTVLHVMSQHMCKLEPGHDGRHVCYCRQEHE